MAISVTCGGCSTIFKVADDMAGKTGKCKQCGYLIVVPSPPSPSIFPDVADDEVEPNQIWSRFRDRSSTAREPWYYPVLVIYAYAGMALGVIITGFVIGMIVSVFASEHGPWPFPALFFSFFGPIVLLFGSAVFGAATLLLVDHARNYRATRLQGHAAKR